MNDRLPPLRGRLLLPAVLFLVAGCGGGGGGGGASGGSSRMSIVECSLQCNDSASNPGIQISCGLTNVFVNQEIRIAFSSPIDPTTVTNNSFQMVEAGTGKTPAGTFALDQADSKTLIYRPQLTFDSAGNPIFGLTQDKTYFFKIPGAAVDPLGPYISNTSGIPNATRLQCTLVASEGVLDATPGRPRVTVTVDRVTAYDSNGDPSEFDVNAAAPGALNVYRNSPVRMVFNDVMNPATLANPVTDQSSFIRAFVDADGDTTDRSDQVGMSGAFTVTIDPTAARTTVIFTPSGGLPSAGAVGLTARKIVMELSPQIADLGGNGLINAGTLSFTPELIQFDPLVIEETFADPSREDPVRTGSSWGSGLLATGPGGGSGRLGDLVVPAGITVVFNTDSEDFSGITNPAIFNPAAILDGVPLVTGGIFEFARMRVDAGAVLRFRGSQPARIYVRGVADVQGLIDVSGSGGVLQSSDQLAGGPGGTPGPSGGAGGRGGSRPDGTNFTGSFGGFPIGGVPNPGVGPADVLDPATYEFVNGIPGGGIAFPNTLDPNPTFVAGGGSGLGWPQPTSLNLSLHMPQDLTDVSGLEPEEGQLCYFNVPSAPGGGGAHALDGHIGDATYVPQSPVTIPPDTPGGDSDALMLDEDARTLRPDLGLLRGGGGGGGGGAHLQQSQVNGRALDDCSIPFPDGEALQVAIYQAHSSAGGGGGGGGFQLAAGRRLLLNGVVDASGGPGGSGTFPPTSSLPTDLAQAGGGGAGGGILLQSRVIQIQAVPGRINVSGGPGGEGTGRVSPIIPSTGGRGSPGFVRLESTVAPIIANEETKIIPTEQALRAIYGSGIVIEDIVSSGEWTPPANNPSGWSGAQSCWIRPTGNFFRLVFEEDQVGSPGWDMTLRIEGQANPQSFRGENDLFPGMTLEEVFGTDFGGAPVVVRFQGARALSVLVDPCSVPETGAGTPLSVPSLTGWVAHPEELNDFHADDSLSPNIFRFIVLWDGSQVDFDGIQGLDDLRVTIQPD